MMYMDSGGNTGSIVVREEMVMNLYYGFHVLSFVVAVIWLWIMSEKYGIKSKKAIPMVACCYLTMYAVMLVLYWICTGVFGGGHLIRAMVFLPIIVWFYSLVWDVPCRQALDMVAIVLCVVHVVLKIGCQVTGCCESWWQVEWGIYNADAGKSLFPVQLAEGLTALVLAIFLSSYAKKRKYRCEGKCMPLMLLLFGITRVGWEFLRDNEKIIFGFSELALWSLLITVVGIIWLLILHIKIRKEECYV